MKKGQKTNEEFVRDIMRFSRRGALIQGFVLQALQSFILMVMQNYESGVLAKNMDGNAFVTAEVWADCAREILEKMDTPWKGGHDV